MIGVRNELELRRSTELRHCVAHERYGPFHMKRILSSDKHVQPTVDSRRDRRRDSKCLGQLPRTAGRDDRRFGEFLECLEQYREILVARTVVGDIHANRATAADTRR
jgi:hypothetical protein